MKCKVLGDFSLSPAKSNSYMVSLSFPGSSIYENVATAGFTHLLEHLQFGTGEKRETFFKNNILKSNSVTALTTKNCTTAFVKCSLNSLESRNSNSFIKSLHNSLDTLYDMQKSIVFSELTEDALKYELPNIKYEYESVNQNIDSVNAELLCYEIFSKIRDKAKRSFRFPVLGMGLLSENVDQTSVCSLLRDFKMKVFNPSKACLLVQTEESTDLKKNTNLYNNYIVEFIKALRDLHNKDTILRKKIDKRGEKIMKTKLEIDIEEKFRENKCIEQNSIYYDKDALTLNDEFIVAAGIPYEDLFYNGSIDSIIERAAVLEQLKESIKVEIYEKFQDEVLRDTLLIEKIDIDDIGILYIRYIIKKKGESKINKDKEFIRLKGVVESAFKKFINKTSEKDISSLTTQKAIDYKAQPEMFAIDYHNSSSQVNYKRSKALKTILNINDMKSFIICGIESNFISSDTKKKLKPLNCLGIGNGRLLVPAQ